MVDSSPIMVICFNDKHEEIDVKFVLLDFTHVSENNLIRQCYVFNIKDKISLYESFMVDHSVHIFHYLNSELVNMIDCYFNFIFEQHKEIDKIELHYYCDDFEFPYYFSKQKNDISFTFFRGTSYAIIYTKIIEESGDEYFYFDENMYKNTYKSHKNLFGLVMRQDIY